MAGLLEVLYLLFSGADMMLTVLVKPFIVHSVSSAMRTTSNSTSFDATDSAKSFSMNSTSSTLPSEGRGVLSVVDEEEQMRQERVAIYLMTDLVCVYVSSTLVSSFCGAWSDSNRHGRKPPLLFPPIGQVLCVMVYVTLVPYFSEYLMAWLILAAMCRGLLGKGAVFSMAISSLLCDKVSLNERSARFASLMASRYIGMCLGSLAAGVLQDIVGLRFGMIISAALQVFCIIVTVYFVKETIQNSDENITWNKCKVAIKTTKLCVFKDRVQTSVSWSVRESNYKKIPILRSKENRNGAITREDSERSRAVTVKEGDQIGPKTYLQEEAEEEKDIIDNDAENYVTAAGDYSRKSDEEDLTNNTSEKTVDEREFGRRMAVVIVLLLMNFVVDCLTSSQTEVIVLTISAPPLSWSSSWYGYLCTTYFGAAGLGLLVLGRCQKSFQRSSAGDCVVLLLSVVSCAVCSVWTGLAAVSFSSSWQIFGAYVVGAQVLMSNSAFWTLISQCTSADSSGKVMAALSMLENLGKMLGPLFHSAVYVSSLVYWPSLVYFVMSGEGLLLLPLILWIHKAFSS